MKRCLFLSAWARYSAGSSKRGICLCKNTPPRPILHWLCMQEGKCRCFLGKQEKTYFKWSIRQGTVSTFLPGVFSMALCQGWISCVCPSVSCVHLGFSFICHVIDPSVLKLWFSFFFFFLSAVVDERNLNCVTSSEILASPYFPKELHCASPRWIFAYVTWLHSFP